MRRWEQLVLRTTLSCTHKATQTRVDVEIVSDPGLLLDLPAPLLHIDEEPPGVSPGALDAGEVARRLSAAAR